MLQAETIHRYTFEKDQIYLKAWRNLGLNGVNSSWYNAKARSEDPDSLRRSACTARSQTSTYRASAEAALVEFSAAFNTGRHETRMTNARADQFMRLRLDGLNPFCKAGVKVL